MREVSKEQACLALTERKSWLPLLAGAPAVCIGDGEQGKGWVMIPVPQPHCLVSPWCADRGFFSTGRCLLVGLGLELVCQQCRGRRVFL